MVLVQSSTSTENLFVSGAPPAFWFNENTCFDKIQRHLMKAQRTRFRFSDLRACLVVAALISLCVSSNVGPRFLPLPAIPDGSAINHRTQSGLRHSHSEADSFRVPMMAQTQKRSDREPQQPQLVLLPEKDALISLSDRQVAVELRWANLLEPPSLSLSFGRAPPSLV